MKFQTFEESSAKASMEHGTHMSHVPIFNAYSNLLNKLQCYL